MIYPGDAASMILLMSRVSVQLFPNDIKGVIFLFNPGIPQISSEFYIFKNSSSDLKVNFYCISVGIRV